MLQSHFVTVLCAVSGAHGPDTAVRVTDTIVVLGHVPYRPQDGLQRPRSLDFSDRERARNVTDLYVAGVKQKGQPSYGSLDVPGCSRACAFACVHRRNAG